MRRTETIIIGAGQAGLALSRWLTDFGLDHVLLERGQIAERWRSSRWDSLRLLTPAWMTRLPKWQSDADPREFLSMRETIALFERYASSFRAPVEEHTVVRVVERVGDEYRVLTNADEWRAKNVVIATGQCDAPFIPDMAAQMSGRIEQVVPSGYRRPADLPPGGVLVVGASATGVQLADEIHASGRPVTLAVGRHIRMPRRYRGADVFEWLDRIGVLDERVEDLPNPAASRAQPSLQLVGRREHEMLDLQVLAESGVRLVGRAIAAEGERICFADDLAMTTHAAERKLRRLLCRIDAYIDARGLAAKPIASIRPIELESRQETLDLAECGIRTIVWATGFKREYSWLRVPVLDARGEIEHRAGVTKSEGLYVLGLHLMRTRRSSYIDGVGSDALALASHISARAHRAGIAA